MKKILLTGATGFIGSHVFTALFRNGNEMILPVRNSDALHKIKSPLPLHICRGDFYDSRVLQECGKHAPGAIVHIAGIRGDGNGSWRDYYRVNVEGTEKLVDFAIENGVKNFIYLSSVGVYGSIPGSLPATVKLEAAPDNDYHKSKFEAEEIVRQKLNNKISFAIIRPSITYGQRDNGFIPRLIYLVKRRLFPLVRTDIKIHLLNVHTIAEIIARLVNDAFADNLIFNLADREPVSLKMLVDEIYRFFYRKNYPGILQMPLFGMKTGERMMHVLGLGKYETSAKLISHSWYYDVQDVETKFGIPLTDTMNSMRNLLENNFACS